MRNVTIRKRADGVTELAPTLRPLDPADRAAVIGTVLFVTGGLFLSGAVPAGVAAAIGASCIAGEVVLAVKAAALALLRPAAAVHDLPRLQVRRRAR